MRKVLGAAAAVVILAGCHNPDAYIIGPDTVDAVLAVTVSEATLPANGIARATIAVQIDPRTDAAKRSVAFATSAGTLIGGGKEGSATSVNADTSGKAVVELRSGTTPASARVDITVGTITRTTMVEFVPADLSGIITLEQDSSSRAADGSSAINFVARVAPGLSAERRKVTFRTTLGTFLPGKQDSFTIDADGGNTARATLVSSVVGSGRVTAATGDGITAFADVAFLPSLPDSLFVSPAGATISAGESMVITVTLLRSSGQLSPQQQVTYSATTSSGASIGVFSGVSLTNSSNVSQATFNLAAGTAYLGVVTIRASSGGKEGTATIEVAP